MIAESTKKGRVKKDELDGLTKQEINDMANELMTKLKRLDDDKIPVFY